VSTDEPDIHEAISPQCRDITIQWTSHLWLERFAHPAEVFSSDPRRDRGTFISHFASLVICALSTSTIPVEDLPSPALAMTDVRRPGYQASIRLTRAQNRYKNLRRAIRLCSILNSKPRVRDFDTHYAALHYVALPCSACPVCPETSLPDSWWV
jgi:hypothetical protein